MLCSSALCDEFARWTTAAAAAATAAATTAAAAASFRAYRLEKGP